MELVKVKIENFRSIEDSGEFNIDKMTCLVGKNEAGKTALLQALNVLKPYDKEDEEYDKTNDYPRRHLSAYDERHPNGKANVVTTWWKLSEEAKDRLVEEFGKYSIKDDIFTITKGYEHSNSFWGFEIDQEKAIKHIIKRFKLTATEKNTLENKKSIYHLTKRLQTMDKTARQENLLEHLEEYRDGSIYKKAIDLVKDLMPSFFYVSHYDRMSGKISVEHLGNYPDKASKGDEIFLQFLELAGTGLEDLKNSEKHEELTAKCEAASNHITDQIFEYWSQNDALEVQVKIAPGQSGDPHPFNSGTVVHARVKNNIHRVTVPFSERSAGFVWFFSFLIQFAQIRKQAGNLIILLDEPGLTLHGKAQADLLRYIEEKLLPHHQVIFTTHSPFMVPAKQLESVRIVEDVMDRSSGRPNPLGTKVSADILVTDKDTIFPLQGALGYDITQSLFVGNNTLLVEGPSDILYLQGLSEVLKRKDREYLDAQWVMCPTGGISKVSPFISLFGGNDLNVAVLTDYQRGDRTNIQNIKEGDILKTGHLYTVADFVDKNEADIEDVFEKDLFIQIVNQAFDLSVDIQLDSESIDSSDRLIKQVEEKFRVMPPDAPNCNHFTPAYWLIKNLHILETTEDSVLKTLDRAEKIFQTFNELLA